MISGRWSLLLSLAVIAGSSYAFAQTPVITRVSKITVQQFQTIVITGSGFGTHAPYTGDSNYIAFWDLTANPGWQAGYAPFNDTVTLIVQQWQDSRIVLGGFSGGWGESNWILTLGDSVEIQVWNPQSGGGPAEITTTVVLEPTTTTLTSSPNPSNVGQPVTFTSEVFSTTGVPPDGEPVLFMRGSTVLAKRALNGGSARFVTSTLPVGATPVVAVYRGDPNFAASKSPTVNQVVH